MLSKMVKKLKVKADVKNTATKLIDMELVDENGDKIKDFQKAIDSAILEYLNDLETRVDALEKQVLK